MDEFKQIAAFPLPIIVFPNEEVRLHIFEPRYKQLIQDCVSQKIVFGIIPVIDNVLQQIGAVMKLIQIVKEYPDGRMDIRLTCISLFKNNAFYQCLYNKLYPGTEAEIIDNENLNSDIDYTNTIELFNELCVANNAKPYQSIDWENFNSYKIGHYVGFNLKQEYIFSTILKEEKRLEYINEQLIQMIEQSKMRQMWLTRLSMNGEFHNYSS